MPIQNCVCTFKTRAKYSSDIAPYRWQFGHHRNHEDEDEDGHTDINPADGILVVLVEWLLMIRYPIQVRMLCRPSDLSHISVANQVEKFIVFSLHTESNRNTGYCTPSLCVGTSKSSNCRPLPIQQKSPFPTQIKTPKSISSFRCPGNL